MRNLIVLDLSNCPTAQLFEAKHLIREELVRRQNALNEMLAATAKGKEKEAESNG